MIGGTMNCPKVKDDEYPGHFDIKSDLFLFMGWPSSKASKGAPKQDYRAGPDGPASSCVQRQNVNGHPLRRFHEGSPKSSPTQSPR